MKYSHNYVIKSQNHDLKIITIFVYHLANKVVTLSIYFTLLKIFLV